MVATTRKRRLPVVAALESRANPQLPAADTINSITVEGPTVAAKPTPTPRPKPVYLPILLKEKCTVTYRFADGKQLLGKTLWLQAQDTDGPQVLNYRFAAEQ